MGHKGRFFQFHQGLLGRCRVVNIHRMRTACYRASECATFHQICAGQRVQTLYPVGFPDACIDTGGHNAAILKFHILFLQQRYDCEHILPQLQFCPGHGFPVCAIAGAARYIDRNAAAVYQRIEPWTAELAQFSLLHTFQQVRADFRIGRWLTASAIMVDAVP